MPAPDSSLALEPPRSLPRSAAEASDAELVGHAVAGERWAEEILYKRHSAAVIGVVTRLLGRMGDAEDAAQDTFLIALSGLAELRDRNAFRGWLLGIAVHQAHRRFRKRKLLRRLGLDRGQDDAGLAQQALPGVDAETRTELSKLDVVLSGLPTNERTAWMLRHVESMELKEVAEVTGVSLATVKRWIARADRRVAEHVRLPDLMRAAEGSDV